MTFRLVSRKIIDPSGSWMSYRTNAIAYDRDHESFLEWVKSRETRCQWNHFPWWGWAFADIVDDVAIRIQWAEHFDDPDDDEHRDYVSPRSKPPILRLMFGKSLNGMVK